MITSREFRAMQSDLDILQVEVNDELPYWDGQELSLRRYGFKPVSGLEILNNAVKARQYAHQLLAAADAMDERLRRAGSAAGWSSAMSRVGLRL